jgi:hypothetical protein
MAPNDNAMGVPEGTELNVIHLPESRSLVCFLQKVFSVLEAQKPSRGVWLLDPAFC